MASAEAHHGLDVDLGRWRERALELEDQVARAVVGQTRLIRMIHIAVFARGHVLLEGDVGVGKTTVLRAFARAIGGAFERVRRHGGHGAERPATPHLPG